MEASTAPASCRIRAVNPADGPTQTSRERPFELALAQADTGPRRRRSVEFATVGVASQAVGRGFESLRPLWFQAIFRRSPESPDSPSPEDRGVGCQPVVIGAGDLLSLVLGNGSWHRVAVQNKRVDDGTNCEADPVVVLWSLVRRSPMFDVLRRSDAVDSSSSGISSTSKLLIRTAQPPGHGFI